MSVDPRAGVAAPHLYKYIIGSGIPIHAFSAQRRAGAHAVLAWKYADAISRRIAECFDAVYVVLPRLQRLS